MHVAMTTDLEVCSHCRGRLTLRFSARAFD